VQLAQRKLDWEPAARFWTPISWVATMALINLGWIFFRANSLPQAREMLRSLMSPTTYGWHFLSGSLYLLVAGLAAGYAIVVLVGDALERCSSESQGSEAAPGKGIIGFLARSRWFWIPPLYVLALIFLLIVTLTRGASTAQFMYNKF
jgi:hypothetical protein